MKFILIFFISVFTFAATEKISESNILQIEKEISETYAKISANNQSIATAQKQIGELKFSIESKKKYIAKRLLAQKSIKSQSWITILNTKNKAIFDRNLKIFKSVNEADLAALHEYKLAFEELKDQENILATENKLLEEHTRYLEDREAELKTAEQKQIELLAKTRAVDHLLNYKGTLSLPIQSQIIDRFGSSYDSENQYTILVKGLVLQGFPKQNITSFGPGKVIFSDHISYWGNSVIISHRGGYFSVYAGVENPMIKVNDLVKNEQVIAQTNGRDFYFELRHQNIPINPLNWIRK
jgi:murein hydrolase activator